MTDTTPRGDIASADAAAVPEKTPPRERRRVLVSSFFGALIEWYDFYLFGVASAVVFNVLFFPEFSSGAGTLAAFATLAIGFFARPIGGAIWGHFGDRVGRKRMLVISIVSMGVATTIVGLLPTYDQIGILAPIALVVMRLVQGISAGGEWGGAVLMTMEHVPERRGLSSSVAQMGLYGGIIVANGVFALVSLLPREDLLSWGWRLPFLFSSVLVVIGLWIRLGVGESPVFKAAQAKAAEMGAERPKSPLLEVVRKPRALIIAMLLVVGPFAASAVYGTFAISYGIELGFTATQTLNATLLAAVIGLVGQPVFAGLSDYVGRKIVVGVGAVLQGISGFILFSLMNTGDVGSLYAGMFFAAFAHAVIYSPVAAWLGELFPTHLRYSGASLGYQIAGTVGGGLTPLICSSLLLAAGGAPNTHYVSYFLLAICALTMVGVVMAKETYRSEL